jgi:hypothetical protein
MNADASIVEGSADMGDMYSDGMNAIASDKHMVALNVRYWYHGSELDLDILPVSSATPVTLQKNMAVKNGW